MSDDIEYSSIEATNPGDSLIVGFVDKNGYHDVIGIKLALETFEAVLISTRESFIGLTKPYKQIGWNIYERSFNHKLFEQYGCMYGWRVSPKLLVGLVQSKILMPNQVCSICRLPAPHSKPNNDKDFICASCKLLGEL